MKTQVLVVGAGPVGMTMAAELARQGISVRLVDKAAERTDKSKALVLWSRTLELLDRGGMSGRACVARLLAAGNKVGGVNIVAGEGKVIGHLSLAKVPSPYPFALMLPQSETERLLDEHLERLGVRVERPVELTTFGGDEGSGGVRAVLRAADGREETVHTDWLVGCDGAHSTVRHTLGMPFLGNTLTSDWMLADIHLVGYPFPESEIAIYWHPKGVLVIFPISPGRFRVVADIGTSNDQPPTAPTLAQAQAIIAERGPRGLAASDPVWLSAFRINERKVADYRGGPAGWAGRVLVAGDAAHVHSPAGGQGMNTGMQDAFNLAWKLAMVCRGVCGERLLESYSIERSAIGEQVLKAAGRLTMAAVLKNPALQAVRNFVGHALLGLSPVREAMADTMTEIAVGYGGTASPLNGPHTRGVPGPQPGERVEPGRTGGTDFPAAELQSGREDRERGPRFVLHGERSAAVGELLTKYPDLLDNRLLAALQPGGLWLVRPDGYVACAVRADETAAIAGFLDGLR